MSTPQPILVAPLFRDITGRLLELLNSLGRDDWHMPTVSSRRNVKDIVSHLLDGSLRRLSMQRDGYMPPDGSSRPRANESMLDFLNRLNDEWEIATRRMSPTVLVSLIEWADDGLADLFESLDPYAQAVFPVGWAGEEQSLNWMDVARDYTEKWHHTQQIFDATGRASSIVVPRLYHPCLETFMRALPHTFRDVQANEGTVVSVRITGDAGGEWFVQRTGSTWTQITETTGTPAARFTVSQESAWKLFTKRIDRQAALTRFPDIRTEGDVELASNVIDMVSVMA